MGKSEVKTLNARSVSNDKELEDNASITNDSEELNKFLTLTLV